MQLINLHGAGRGLHFRQDQIQFSNERSIVDFVVRNPTSKSSTEKIEDRRTGAAAFWLRFQRTTFNRHQNRGISDADWLQVSSEVFRNPFMLQIKSAFLGCCFILTIHYILSEFKLFVGKSTRDICIEKTQLRKLHSNYIERSLKRSKRFKE